MVLQPLFSGTTEGAVGIAGFLLNETDTALKLRANPAVRGTTPRWAVLADVLSRDEPTRNTSCFLLVIDSEREERIGLGVNWGRRPLGEQETYMVRRRIRRRRACTRG